MLKRLISVILVLSLVLAGISAAFADSLRIGSRGDEVRKLQKALQKLGLKVDFTEEYSETVPAGSVPFMRPHCWTADVRRSRHRSSAPGAISGE